MKGKLDRIRGALYGVAIGDALGGPLELMTEEEILQEHGTVTNMIGGGWLGLAPGETTDDTAMTMAVALGIEENPEDPVPAIGRRFIEWYESVPKGIGGTCRSSIASARRFIRCGANEHSAWECSGANKSEGNGALMRTIYPALYYTDQKQRQQIVRQIATMTHGGERSTRICAEYAEIVHAFIGGKTPERLYAMSYSHVEPTGYVEYTWANVLEAFKETKSFDEALINAVNRGGDADTVGAILGGMAGACYGYKAIPGIWIEALDGSQKKQIDRLAEKAFANHIK